MENTIYNAIQKGIANALVIDGETSINYRKSEIDNNKEMSFSELAEMFRGNNDILFSIDTGRFFMLIGKDGKEYPLREFGKTEPVLLKITVPENPHEIIIALENNHYWKSKLKWYETYWDEEDEIFTGNIPDYQDIRSTDAKMVAKEDFDGYGHTQEIIQKYKNNNKEYAAGYCGKQVINAGSSVYQGYLPAAGEVYFIMKYIDMLNYIFERLDTYILSGVEKIGCKLYMWTSSEIYKNMVWIGDPDRLLLSEFKNQDAHKTQTWTWYNIYAMPLFKKMD